ncbi:MAG: TonB-dependent receptor [Ignavibacteriaceae bacterium]
MQVIFYQILVLGMLSQTMFSQQFVTVLDSQSSTPISDVIIQSLNSEKTDVTDSSGRFDVLIFISDDSIRVSHLAYETVIISVNEIISKKVLRLKNNIILQETVNVTDAGYYNTTNFKESIILTTEDKSKFVTIGDLLNNKTSLYIKDFGGFAGVKTISSRGMGSENTIVLFNEARVNDLRTGIFDLSSMSPGSIAQIDFNKISKGESGYISSGGVLSLYTEKEFIKRTLLFTLKYNSDLYNSGFFSFSDGNSNLNFSLNFERAYSPNEFSYEFESVKRKRTNAHFNKTFVDGNIFANSDWLKINAYGMYSYFNSGIPGFVVTNNYSSSRASNLSRSYLGVLKADFILSDDFTFITVNNYNKQDLKISDPDGVVIFDSESKESNLYDFTTLNRLRYSSSPVNLIFGYEYNYSRLNDITTFISANDVPDEILRNSNKLFINADYKFLGMGSVIQSFMLSGFTAYQHIEEHLGEEVNSDEFAYSFGLKILPATKHYFAIKFNYADNFRYPTFNERYYSSLFNHNQLKPEKYKSFDAGFESTFNFLDNLIISVAYFYIKAEDKIIWVPTRLALQTPRNFAKVVSQGFELSLKQIAFDDLFHMDVFYTFTDARNKNQTSAEDLSYNKLLIYSPQHQFNFNITLNLYDFTLSSYTTYLSERFYTSDNDVNSVLPQYVVFDASVSYRFEILNFKQSLVLTAYNLLNESYFIIQSYPMPLRTFLITYNMEIL